MQRPQPKLQEETAVSRTIRRKAFRPFRHPKGRRQAMVRGARSLPPSERDDIHHASRGEAKHLGREER